MASLSHLGGRLASLDLRQTSKTSLGLVAHDAATKMALDLKILGERNRLKVNEPPQSARCSWC